MVQKCEVRGCSNRSGLLKPKTDEQHQRWKNAVGSVSTAAKRHFFICCEHFSTQQFERDFAFELTGKKTPNYILLKKNAMPDINLVGMYNNSQMMRGQHKNLLGHEVPRKVRRVDNAVQIGETTINSNYQSGNDITIKHFYRYKLSIIDM